MHNSQVLVSIDKVIKYNFLITFYLAQKTKLNEKLFFIILFGSLKYKIELATFCGKR